MNKTLRKKGRASPCAPEQEERPPRPAAPEPPDAGFLALLERELSLPESPSDGPLALDLYAGCGGLGLGFAAAGFRTIGFDRDENACASYRVNLRADCDQVDLTPEVSLPPDARVIIAGPPCQPFSVLGSRRGRRDRRNGLPVFLAAVERVRPELALFENVRGLTVPRSRAYLDSVVEALSRLDYQVEEKVLNAADYGVPQCRHRLFVVAHRGGWRFPEPTHEERHVSAGAALGESALLAPPGSLFLTPAMDEYVARYEAKSRCGRPRDLHLDRPARTLTCRNLGGTPGDMLRVRLSDGRRRRLTIREGARLQGFPDWFTFCGPKSSQCDQVANAVPPLLAKAVALAVRRCLEGAVRR